MEVTESDTVVSVCVVLKSNLKRDVDIYLDVVGKSATGEDLFMMLTMSIDHVSH